MKRIKVGRIENGKYVSESVATDPNRLVEMLATQTPPGTKGTDRAFMEDRHDPVPGAPEWLVKEVLKTAKKAGINTSGKTYKGFLADSRGHADPEAWVSGIDDVKRVARKRNKNLTGAVEHRAVELPPEPDIRLAEDIVQRKMRQYIAKDRKWAKKPGELRDMVIEKHGAKA